MRRIQSPESVFSKSVQDGRLWRRCPVGEFRTGIGLDTRNGIRELLNNMVKEDAGRKGAVFLKSLGIAETGTLVDEGVLAYW